MDKCKSINFVCRQSVTQFNVTYVQTQLYKLNLRITTICSITGKTISTTYLSIKWISANLNCYYNTTLLVTIT